MSLSFLIIISVTSLGGKSCTQEQKNGQIKSAEICLKNFYSKIDFTSSCAETDCDKIALPCHKDGYIENMQKFFQEKAIYYK